MIPEYKFPTSPLDCLRAYKFIVNDLHKYVNIKPKKVILAGESAGGNLAFVLSGLILKENLMKPLGIFSSYPSCDMRGLFSPSRVNSLSDPLLSSSVLSFIRA